MMRLIITLTIFLSSILNLQAQTTILPLSEIRPGMKGYGKTVFSGTTIEKFNIEVVEIIQNFEPQANLILIRLVDDRLEKIGVVAGMSGSPIYVDDKLIGALAYSFDLFQVNPIAGVTPIEQMLEIENKENFRNQEIARLQMSNEELMKFVWSGTPEEKFDFLRKLCKSQVINNNYSIQLKPISMPLSCSGINPSVLESINPTLKEMGFQVVPGGTGVDDAFSGDIALQPGDAVSGVLISGDLDISATGTITYRDGNKILAFGHPFFNIGPSELPMAQAKILTVIHSLWGSFKLASTGRIIGNIRQDRSSGILGIIGEQTPTFPVKIEYISPFDQKKEYHYQIAKAQTSSFITPILLWLTVSSTLETARFSSGNYSIRLNGAFNLNGEADIILDNFYTGSNFSAPAGSGQDIAIASSDIAMTLAPLLFNDYKYPDIENIELSFHALPGKKGLQIEKVWYDKTEITPGDILTLTIQLRAYQGELKTVSQQIHIPENIATPRLIVRVGDASYITKWEQISTPGKYQPQNFEQLVQLLNNKRTNNKLYIQLKAYEKGAIIAGKELPNLPPTILNIISNPKLKGPNTNLRELTLKEYAIPMDYSIFGGETIYLTVTKHRTF